MRSENPSISNPAISATNNLPADGPADPDAELHAARHRLQHEAFLRQEDAHERIGRHHREVMARMRDLEECAGAAM